MKHLMLFDHQDVTEVDLVDCFMEHVDVAHQGTSSCKVPALDVFARSEDDDRVQSGATP